MGRTNDAVFHAAEFEIFGKRPRTTAKGGGGRRGALKVPESFQVPLGNVCEIQAFEVVAEILGKTHHLLAHGSFTYMEEGSVCAWWDFTSSISVPSMRPVGAIPLRLPLPLLLPLPGPVPGTLGAGTDYTGIVSGCISQVGDIVQATYRFGQAC